MEHSLIWLVCKWKGNERKSGDYKEISQLSVLGKKYSGIIACRLRDWLLYQTGHVAYRIYKGKEQ